ncbi:MAG: beta-lactamase family protein [Saprospiraceae bacterium]|nr:beta-lactamase family protein [Saprospiraceae bacterium]
MRRPHLLLTGYLLLLIGCHSGTSHSALEQSEGDEDVKGLEKVYAIAKEAQNVRSVLVSVNGALVMEQYFDTYSPDSLDHQRSGTKSIMASLIGIAIDRGMITHLDDPVSSYLNVKDERLKTISIRHLLSMTSGFDWDEEVSVDEYNAWVSSGDQLGFLLKKAVIHPPGKVWNYNSATMHLLSMILTKVSGMSTLEFAKQFLFEPIGIKQVSWERLSSGFYNGGAGLQLRPRDMIKLGELHANVGQYAGQQVVSKQFIEAAISHQEPEPFESDENIGYGYGWWVGEPNGVKAFLARGYAGQIIAVFPEKDLVVAITHNWRVEVNTAIAQQKQAFEILAAILLEEVAG